jgi:hypothetical protein
MIWLYEKDARTVALETRYDNRTLQYVLTIHRSEGDAVERYERLEDFRQRLMALERALTDDDWHRAGPPLLSPAGWPDRLPQ